MRLKCNFNSWGMRFSCTFNQSQATESNNNNQEMEGRTTIKTKQHACSSSPTALIWASEAAAVCLTWTMCNTSDRLCRSTQCRCHVLRCQRKRTKPKEEEDNWSDASIVQIKLPWWALCAKSFKCEEASARAQRHLLTFVSRKSSTEVATQRGLIK